MKPTKIMGIYKDRNKLFTENPTNCKGIKIYNEQIIKQKNKEYRSWNPYRSKMAAALLNGLEIDIKPDMNILYLGAATGTTISHISDILEQGIVFGVEISPVAVKKLLEVSEKRTNVLPILADAFHPDRYSSVVPLVDFVYQDISQRNQDIIFVKNIQRYLKKNCQAVIMVKSRSIDVSLPPKKVYDIVCSRLEENNLKIVDIVDLKPYEKDHAAILISNH